MRNFEARHNSHAIYLSLKAQVVWVLFARFSHTHIFPSFPSYRPLSELFVGPVFTRLNDLLAMLPKENGWSHQIFALRRVVTRSRPRNLLFSPLLQNNRMIPVRESFAKSFRCENVSRLPHQSWDSSIFL